MTGPIGLIGLGHVGMALAHRLLASSHKLVGYRRSGMAEFSALGGTAAESVSDVVAHCDTIILALPDAAISAAVQAEIFAAAITPKTLIDITTMAPADAIAAAQAAAGRGHAYLEAPLSGTAVAIRDHAATMVVGCDGAAFEASRVLLGLLAASVAHVGPPGGASAIKSAAMMMIAVNLLGAAEALAYVENFGIDPRIALDALKAGPAASGALNHRGPLMAARDYRPMLGRMDGFAELLRGIADSASTPVAMLRQAVAQMDQAVSAGAGGLDAAAVYEQFRPQ